MSNISLNLSNKVPDDQVEIVREVVDAAESLGLRLFIVGAKVRDFLLQYAHDLPVHRVTNDIDFGVVVESWDEFNKLWDHLMGNESFQPHKTMNQRLVHESGLFIDLVPFGGLERVSGQISWPPDFSIVMSTVGFREAYESSIVVRFADDLMVRVASLAGLALLKIVAWNERRLERDAVDLGLILRNYLDAGNQDRIYTEHGDCLDLLDEEFEYDKASARVLGRDIGRLVTDTSRMVIERVLSEERSAEALAVMMVNDRTNYNGDYELALAMLAELQTGISEA